jgi:predicted nucleotidyltransferase
LFGWNDTEQPVNLSDTEREIIAAALKQLPEVDAVSVFGSRARDTASRYADLDLLLHTSHPIPLRRIGDVEHMLAESDLTFSVDIIDSSRIDAAFRVLIEDELVPFV